jgi:required for meiotic nuclear division protein 1
MPKRVKSDIDKFIITTSYLGEKIDLRKLQENIKEYKFLNIDQPLVMELPDDQYVVLTKFGTVTLWNIPKQVAKEFIKEISPFVRSSRQEYGYTDSLEVHVGAAQEKLTFEEAYIKKLDVERIKIISYVSAQSVALDRYEEEIDQHLINLGRVIDDLKSSGKTHFNQRSLLKEVGRTLSVKQNTVSDLSLLDKPNSTWKTEDIEKLYDHLRDAYELRDRFDILNEKIDFLSENSTTLLEVISSQKAERLEIIVIGLIIVEIVLFIIDMFKIPL